MLTVLFICLAGLILLSLRVVILSLDKKDFKKQLLVSYAEGVTFGQAAGFRSGFTSGVDHEREAQAEAEKAKAEDLKRRNARIDEEFNTFATSFETPVGEMDDIALDAQVLHIISGQLGTHLEDIHWNSSFVDDLGMDSLDAVELVMKTEDVFSIEIADEDTVGLTTPGAAVNYLQAKLQKKALSVPVPSSVVEELRAILRVAELHGEDMRGYAGTYIQKRIATINQKLQPFVDTTKAAEEVDTTPVISVKMTTEGVGSIDVKVPFGSPVHAPRSTPNQYDPTNGELVAALLETKPVETKTYHEGVDAFGEGLDLTDNPYIKGGVLFEENDNEIVTLSEEWASGWRVASDETTDPNDSLANERTSATNSEGTESWPPEAQQQLQQQKPSADSSISTSDSSSSSSSELGYSPEAISPTESTSRSGRTKQTSRPKRLRKSSRSKLRKTKR